MEDHLDRIESGREGWKKASADFYELLSSRLEVAKTEMRDVKTEAVETDEVCEKCSGKMVIKWGKFGRFLACPPTRLQEHKANLKNGNSGESENAQQEEILCEKCGKPMVLKRGDLANLWPVPISRLPEPQKIVKSAENFTVNRTFRWMRIACVRQETRHQTWTLRRIYGLQQLS
jgi:ssDNA-binding Zn-finger/Zn-ribbon topoisomerase 1